MRYRKRTNDYVGSNFYFDPKTKHATSYEWYDLVKEINGVVILNDYSYSSSTCKHIEKVRNLLKTHDINYVTLEAPKGLQDLCRAKRYYEDLVKNLSHLIVKPGTRKAKNQERMAQIARYGEKLYLLSTLGVE